MKPELLGERVTRFAAFPHSGLSPCSLGRFPFAEVGVQHLPGGPPPPGPCEIAEAMNSDARESSGPCDLCQLVPSLSINLDGPLTSHFI